MKKNLFKLFLVMLFLLTISFTIVFNNNNSISADEIENEEEVVEPSLNIYKQNVSYSSEIYIMYAVSYEGIDVTVNPVKMLFFDTVQDEYTTTTATAVIKTSGATTIGGVKCLIFASNGLAAKQMTDDIYARAYVEINDEIIYSEVVKYSVLEYYYEAKESGTVSTNILNLLEAMVNYGAAAQINFNHNTDRLANATYYKVNVENAVLPDGFTSGRYQNEEQVTLTAPLKEGYVFTGWTNSNNEVVSTEATYTLTVTKNETLIANYEEEVAVTPVTLTLTKEAAYDATTTTLDLPSTVTFDYNNETVTENVTWDTTSFVVNQIGKQKLYGTLSNDSYKLDELSIEINVLPYTFYLNEETNEYTITKYYGNEQDIVIPSTFDNKYITKIGDSVFNNCSSLKNIFISKEIKFVLGGAFYNCTNLEKVYYLGSIEEWCKIDFYANNYCSTPMYYADNFYLLQDNIFNEVIEIEIPDSISYIGNHQFSGFKNVEKITISDRVENIGSYAFYNCSNLVEIVIPDSVIEIKACAFFNCTGLNTITLGKNIKTILGSNFGQCTNLKNVYFNGTLENWCSIEFELDTATPMYYGEIIYMLDENNEWYELTNVEIPNTVASIGKYQFYGFKKILNVDISNSVIEINLNAFSNCTSLKNVVIPDSVISIGSYAFNNCSNLVEIVIPDSVVKIGISAFSNCTNLKNVTISNSITSISDHAFAYCSNLCEIIIPKNVTIIDRYAFYNCSNLLCVEIPNTVKSIGLSAFSGCDSLTSVIFEENSQLTSIGNYVFNKCSDLKTIIIPSNVTSIGNESFYRCDNLISIVISENITNIGTYAFYDCKNLKIIYNLSDLELTIGSTDHGYVAYYAKYIHNELPREVSLEKEVAYDATVDTLDLPESVTFTYNEEEITQNVTWDTSTFIVNQIGEQVIYGTFNDDELYDKYNIKRGYIYITIDVLPYTFSLDETTNEYAITKYYGTSEEETIPETFNNVPIVTINQYAFDNCLTLKNLIIPTTINKIELSAIYGCNSLESITIPFIGGSLNSGNPFGYIFGANLVASNFSYVPYSLTSVNILEGLTRIEDRPFMYCRNLINITIPSSVTSIGAGAFDNCISLMNVYYEGTIESWCNIVFPDFSDSCNPMYYAEHFYMKNENENWYEVTEIEIPDTFTEIGDYQFFGFENITSITIPSGVSNIGERAFSYCNNLMNVYYEGTVESWCNISLSFSPMYYAEHFYIKKDDGSWHEVTEIVIPNEITKIGLAQFTGFENVTSITIPNGITNIENGAFSDCSNLMNVYYEGTIESWCSISFSIFTSNPMYYAEHFYLKNEGGNWYEVTEIEIPSTINAIGNYQFTGFKNITNIELPTSVTSLGKYAFYNCKNLKNLIIPDGVTNIEESAFYSCISLTAVIIPDGVTSIGLNAFYHCSNLISVTIPDEVVNIGYSAFLWCNSLINVYYEGTEEQWNLITIASSNNNLTSATIHYNYVSSTEEE